MVIFIYQVVLDIPYLRGLTRGLRSRAQMLPAMPSRLEWAALVARKSSCWSSWSGDWKSSGDAVEMMQEEKKERRSRDEGVFRWRWKMDMVVLKRNILSRVGIWNGEFELNWIMLFFFIYIKYLYINRAPKLT